VHLGVNTSQCEQVREQMLKMKPQHRKQGNREHVQCVQCAVCIVRTVYSACKWDRIVRTVVQYVLVSLEVGSIYNKFLIQTWHTRASNKVHFIYYYAIKLVIPHFAGLFCAILIT
jgi:ribosomal protein S26